MPLYNPQNPVPNAILPGDAVNVRTLTRAGFPNRTDTTITYDSGTQTVTISGTSWDVWANNQRWTKTGSISVVHGTGSGEHYIYFNNSGTLTSSQSVWDPSSDQTAPVALVYYASTSGCFADERHGAYRDRTNHKYLHLTRGTAYDFGLSTTFTTSTFTTTAGRVWDEDIDAPLTASLSNARLWYRSGSTMVFEDNVTTPYKLSGTSLMYDNGGSLAAIGSGKYVSSWVYATTDNFPQIAIVVGQNQLDTLTAAQADTQPSFPNRSTREWKLIYQAIFRIVGTTISNPANNDFRNASNLPGSGAPTTIPASQVTYSPTSPLSALTVQGALDQVATTYDPWYENYLDADPSEGVSYTASYSSGLVSNETWNRTGGNKIKSIDYTYAASLLTTGTIKVFDTNGSTVLAQVTNTFTYSGGILTGSLTTRDV